MTRYSGNIVRAALPGASATGASGNWELEDAAQQIGSGAWPAAVGLNDPNFYQNVLMLNGDGTNGAQNNTFLDSSTNNLTITRNGNATQGSFTPFNGADWSVYFDGSSYVTAPNINFGTSNFTMEGWFYLTTSLGSNTTLFSLDNGAGANPKFIVFLSTTSISIQTASTTSVVATHNGFSTNAWNHVAVVRTSTGAGGIKIYLNGVGLTNTSSSAIGDMSGITSAVYIGFDGESWGAKWTGYISNVRMTSGVALYTTNFTRPALPFDTTANTTLLTCASNTFEDLSGRSKAITLSGSVRVTSFSPFNSYNRTPVSYGTYFDGSGDYITASGASATVFGTGDFTFETWLYISIAINSNEWGIFEAQPTSGAFQLYKAGTTNNLLYGSYGVGGNQILSSANIPLNQWFHVAICRSGSGTNNVKTFVNGVVTGTFTDTTNYNQSGISIGGRNTGANYFTGCISNMRAVTGTALYSANFTPSTTPLTAVSGTSLLTCQSATIRDNSSNAFALTVNGNTQPVKANPFNYTIALGTGYNAATMGGSAYFDGTGDYLSTASTPTLATTTTPFTIECWVYPTVQLSGTALFSTNFTGGGQAIPFCIFGATNINTNTSGSNLCAGYYTGSAWVGVSSTTSLTLNQWSHVALVFNGTVATLYLNGVSIGSATTSWTTSTASPFLIGRRWDTTATPYFTGYIGGFRFATGSALYTGPFVPPTSPVTAVTNTQLLLNMANASIFDYATGVTFGTVSGAKINTTTKKYGTGSIAFNGTTDYLSAPFNPNLNFGTGNFTVECWVYVASSANSDQTIIASNQSWAAGAVLVKAYQTGNVSFSAYDYNSGGTAMVSSAATLNTWVHVALVRNGNTFTLYLNGTSAATQTSTIAVNFAPTNGTYIGHAGAINPTTGYLNGYIDDLRISRYARYTANFTPPGQLQIY